MTETKPDEPSDEPRVYSAEQNEFAELMRSLAEWDAEEMAYEIAKRDARIRADAAPRWIPVDDGGHPPNGMPVLCFHPDWGISVGMNVAGGLSGDWPGEVYATHWQPLPQPPGAPDVE
jgi:hypothetical protein